MPFAPKRVPPPKRASRRHPGGKTTDRGYGHAHQVARKAKLAGSPICQRCNNEWATDLHHADGNPHNRAPANLVALCERCHHAGEHGGKGG